MPEFRMPSLGADMEAGTLVEWRIKPGDTVARGDIVALVETQKGIVEVEIWESGVVEALLVEPGARVPVGTILAKLRDGAGPVPLSAPSVVTSAAAVPAAIPPSAPHVRASPAARHLARERGVDLATLRGTGPHGAITREDVERAAQPVAAPAPAKTAAPTTNVAAMREAIAAAMARSKREIPHYYLATDIEVGRATTWLETENARRPVADRLLFAALLIKATALAAREIPEVNGHYVNDVFRLSKAVNVGVAIALRQGGLVAPCIHTADELPLGELMVKLRDLVVRVRSGTLRSSEMSDPTITVTNLGDQGVVAVYGVIYPPQVALVGFGKVVARPWAEGTMLGVRPVVTATLSADHRASDGHRGARFLAAIARLLNEPEKL